MAPTIVRTYALSFLLLPFNIFSTYYFQAIMKPKAAFVVSVARGLVISGILILLLPVLTGPDSFPVVRHAGHGAADGGLYDLCHPALYQGAVSAKKRYAKRTVFSRK